MSASSMLERMRVLHEEIELLEKAAVALWESKPRATAPALLSELRAAAYIRRIQRISGELETLYEDRDGSRKAETLTLSLGGQEGMKLFYDKLAELKPQAGSTYDIEMLNDTMPTPAFQDAAASSAPASSTPDSSGGIFAGPDAAAEAVLRSFSSEELYGKYIDAHRYFTEFINLPGIKDVRAAVASGTPLETALSTHELQGYTAATCEYTEWLKKLALVHTSLPQKHKTNRAYKKYVSGFAGYLCSFISRTHPSNDIRELLQESFVAFSEAAKSNRLPHWSLQLASTTGSTAAADTTAVVVNLSEFASAAALELALGADGLKVQLQLRGLKSGGTAAERAARLCHIKDMKPEEYPKKLLAVTDAKAGRATASSTATTTTTATATIAASAATHHFPHAALTETYPCVVTVDPVLFAYRRLPMLGLPAAPSADDETVFPEGGVLSVTANITGGETGTLVTAWCEYVVLSIVGEVIPEIVDATRRRLERRSTKTREEREAEHQAEEDDALYGGVADALQAGDDDNEDDEEAPIYNPLNIPLDWDGKPIPVWLFKLHQLNIEYTCEICNCSYRGRRDFDRHFQDWRHTYGMKSLGIPNSKHFHDIVRIEDAKALWAKLQGDVSMQGWRADADEEFEDSMGNVLNRRTYEDLARHGLL